MLSGTKFAKSQPWSLAVGWQGPGDPILHPRKDAAYHACYNTIILTAEVLALRLGLETETTHGDWRRRANTAKLVVPDTEHQEVRTYACSQHISAQTLAAASCTIDFKYVSVRALCVQCLLRKVH